jgi:hypothetical protein
MWRVGPLTNQGIVLANLVPILFPAECEHLGWATTRHRYSPEGDRLGRGHTSLTLAPGCSASCRISGFYSALNRRCSHFLIQFGPSAGRPRQIEVSHLRATLCPEVAEAIQNIEVHIGR